jgi:transcriptional regulator with XRE-family HTH domain
LLANIKRLCTDQGLTIQQLEDKAQIAAGTIGRWGRDGKLMPSVDKVKRVADTLGVTVDELLKEEDDD